MATLFYSHPISMSHQVPDGHPESPRRIEALLRAFEAPKFDGLLRKCAPLAKIEKVYSAHQPSMLEVVTNNQSSQGLAQIDGDTFISKDSLSAALHSVGAACDGIDRIMLGEAKNGFICMRPPGHHAERNRMMGFCLINTIAVAAYHALNKGNLRRVSIIDWDVHHGNGTQDIFYHEPRVQYISLHQMPLYPGTGLPRETGVGNIVNIPTHAGDTGQEYKHYFSTQVMPAIANFKPEMLLISAGFDAHAGDPLGQVELSADDFAVMTEQLCDFARSHASAPILSVLEGGYDLEGLTTSAAAHVEVLMTEGAS